MIKTLLTSAVIATAAIVGGVGSVEANPILNNYQNARNNTTAADINSPRNGGTTTLQEKCEAIQYFQKVGDFGKIMTYSFQAGFEHEISAFSLDEACAIVGVNTYTF